MPVDSHLWSPAEMLYQCALCTTLPQRIRHKDHYAAAERERLEECATQSAANCDHTGCCRKAPLYAGQSVSVINNDRTLWLPGTVVRHWSWLIHRQSHWWSWIQMSTRPHSWTSSRFCQAWHIPQGWSGWTTCHHSINLRSCTATASTYCPHSTTICCSHNTQASCSLKPYSSNLHPAECTCNHRCPTTDQQNWCHTSPI